MTVLPLAYEAAGSDTIAIGYGIAALLSAELAAQGRVRVASPVRPPAVAGQQPDAAVASAARATGASYVVLGTVARIGDSVRVTTRLLRARDARVTSTDTLTAAVTEIPALVDDLADALGDVMAPRQGTTRGGPVFRPPRPAVSFAAMTLYSKAVVARAAGDRDTAARLLGQAVRIAPQWEQPKRDLAALKRRS